MKTTNLCAFAAALLCSASAVAQEKPVDPLDKDPYPHLKTPLPKLRLYSGRDTLPTLLVAPKIGLWVPTSRLKSAAYGGVQVDWVAPFVEGGALTLGVELTWTRPKYSGTISDPSLLTTDNTVNLAASQLGVALLAIWRPLELTEGLVPYLGGGPGLYYHRVASTAFGENALEKESKIGLQLLGGLEYTVGPGGLFLEVQGRLARVDFTMTGFTSLGGLGVGAGYRFRL